jgi:predicted amidohydrolase
MRVAAVQMNVDTSKQANVERALELIDEAAAQGAELVVLPEYVTYVAPESEYARIAEALPGDTSALFAAKAREYGIYLHAGSFVELSPVPEKFYNTSYLLDPAGEIRAVYRKIHLFDVDVPGEVTDQESSYIIPGDRMVAVELPEFILGMSICFDLRFPELFRALASADALVMAVPSAWAEATGRVHWEVLLRARAIENHAYVVAPCQQGLCAGSPHWGHSMILDPWGTILAVIPEGDGVIVADVDAAEARRRRAQVPVLRNRRQDVYEQSPAVVADVAGGQRDDSSAGGS